MFVENGKIQLKGRVRLTAINPLTGEVKAVIEQDNLVVTVGLELSAHILIADTGYTDGWSHCAIGTSDAAPASGQTALIAQTTKKTITKRSTNLDAGNRIITLSSFFLASESNVAIEEAGIFGHTDGDTMLSRALVSYDNSGANPCDVTVDWILTISTT